MGLRLNSRNPRLWNQKRACFEVLARSRARVGGAARSGPEKAASHEAERSLKILADYLGLAHAGSQPLAVSSLCPSPAVMPARCRIRLPGGLAGRSGTIL